MSMKTLIASVVATVVLVIFIWLLVAEKGRSADLSKQLASANQAAGSEKSRLESEAEQQKRNLDRATAAGKKLEKDLATAVGKVKDLESRLSSAEGQVREARAESQKFQAEKQKLEAEAAPLKAELETLRSESAALKTESDSLKTATAPLQAESEALKTEVEALKAQAQEAQSKIDEFTEKQAGLDQNMKTAEARRAALEKEAAALQRYIESNINRNNGRACPPCPVAAPEGAAPASAADTVPAPAASSPNP